VKELAKPDRDDPARVAQEFGAPGYRAVRWAPSALAGSGLELALTVQRGQPLVLHRGLDGGGNCLCAGVAAQAARLATVEGTAIVGATFAEARKVRLGTGPTARTVETVAVPGAPGARYFAVLDRDDSISTGDAELVAFDARGRPIPRWR
jgi:hypothetical protein